MAPKLSLRKNLVFFLLFHLTPKRFDTFFFILAYCELSQKHSDAKNPWLPWFVFYKLWNCKMFALGLSLLLSDAADASTATSARRSLDWVQSVSKLTSWTTPFYLHPRKLTWNLKITPLKRKILLQIPHFRVPSLALGTVIGVSSHSFTKKKPRQKSGKKQGSHKGWALYTGGLKGVPALIISEEPSIKCEALNLHLSRPNGRWCSTPWRLQRVTPPPSIQTLMMIFT